MTTKQDNRAEISMLLPWYAAGTLSAAETRRVAAAIEQDPELARRLEDVREEAAETLLLNESLPAPSRSAADKLFAAIEAESPRVYKPKFSLSSWFTEKLTLVRPRTLAFATTAALAVIALQAGLIVGQLASPQQGYETATAPVPVDERAQILVNFVPEASVADIETLLKSIGGTIADGPVGGGLYRVRLADITDQAGVEQVIETLRSNPDIVRFVAPAAQ